jgi:hypothetical protein
MLVGQLRHEALKFFTFEIPEQKSGQINPPTARVAEPPFFE